MSGNILLKPSRPTQVNTFGTWVFQYKVGRRIWKPGGKLYICTRHSADWSQPQIDDPSGEGFTSIKTNRSVKFFIRYDHWYHMAWHPWQHIFEFIIKKGSLKEGDSITVTFGDTLHGSPGIRCQSFSEHGFRFRVFVDPDETGAFQEIHHPSLGFPITPGPWHKMRVIAPSQPEGKVHVRGLDLYGNTTIVPPSQFFMLIGNRKRINLPTRKSSLVLPQKVSREIKGVTRVHVCDPTRQIEVISNPMIPRQANKLLWGDIHAHSYLCDGINEPEELIRFAREEACLDFAALTTHDSLLDDPKKDFQSVIDMANRANVPGEFTTFIGYEWSGITRNGGDHNIYFSGGKGEVFSSGYFVNQLKNWIPEWLERSTKPPWVRSEMLKESPYAEISKLYSKLNPRNTMAIPHGGGRIANLAYHHPLLEPAVEIFSGHELYERLGHEALLRGYRMGFVGSSDDHRGAMGLSFPTLRNEQIDFTEQGGLTAVWAKESTREAIWKSFQERSVYATSGVRIILQFKVNGSSMGESISLENKAKREIWISANGENYLRQVELWRNLQLLRIWRVRKRDIEISFTDDSPLGSIKWPDSTLWGERIRPAAMCSGIPIKRAEAVYFVKVIQVDGHVACSSPVWIDRTE